MADKKKNTRSDRVAEVMASVTDAIIADIESGLASPNDLAPSWASMGHALDVRNVATGARYRGGNRLNLGMLVAMGASPYWGTYDQWASVGQQVTCKAASYILRPVERVREVEDEETGDKTVYKYLSGFKAHAVWHGGQFPDWVAPAVDYPDALVGDDLAECYKATEWAARIGVKVTHGQSGAFYSPFYDFVGMPDPECFFSAVDYWSTLGHECIHWTRHGSRLNRDPGFRSFGDEAYAAEELCAELGAAFVMADLGLSSTPRPDHAQYLAHWLKVLKSSPDALWKVAGKSQKAAEYLADRAEVGGFVRPEAMATV